MCNKHTSTYTVPLHITYEVVRMISKIVQDKSNALVVYYIMWCPAIINLLFIYNTYCITQIETYPK